METVTILEIVIVVMFAPFIMMIGSIIFTILLAPLAILFELGTRLIKDINRGNK